MSAIQSRLKIPAELSESIKRFKKDYPAPQKVAFIMMRFGKTQAHDRIVASLRSELEKHRLVAVRADQKDYHDDLYWNILTYLYGCGFGIAVFERLESDEFNPNVSLEVGFMLALKKPVLLLKDRTLKNLTADLIGKLYKTFDPQAISETLEPEVRRWLLDKGLIKSEKEQHNEAVILSEFVIDPYWQSLARLSGKSMEALFTALKDSTSREDFLSHCFPEVERRQSLSEAFKQTRDEDKFEQQADALRQRLGLAPFPSRKGRGT